MVRKQILTGAALLTGGQLLGRVCTFARTLILARVLGPDDFGVGALFTMTVGLLEMMSDMSVGQLVVQSDKGDERRFVSAAHFFTIARGLVMAALLLLLAPVFAGFFNAPEAVDAFRWLALVPVLRGVAHLDHLRMQRRMDYRADVTAFTLSEILAVAAALPIALLVGDFTAVLWVILVQVVSWVVFTHLLAERRFSASPDRSFMYELIRFGWPLLLNGLLLYGVLQGDKLVVAWQYSNTELGWYAAAVMLTMTPMMMLSRIARSITLPLLSSVKQDRARYGRRYSFASSGIACASAAFGVGSVLLGAWVTEVAYGAEYAAAGAIVAWLGVAQSFRMLRVAPSIASMAVGDTKNMMYGNIARVSVLAPIVFIAITGGDLMLIPKFAVVGEAMALVVVLARLQRRQNLPSRGVWLPGSVCALGVAAAVLAAPSLGVWASWLVGWPGITGLCVLALIGLTPGWREELARLKRRGQDADPASGGEQCPAR